MADAVPPAANAGDITGNSDGREMDAIVTSVRSLVEIMRSGGISELDISFADVTLRLRGGSTTTLTATAPSTIAPPTASVSDSASSAPTSEQYITSPMVGTFYSASTPDAPPYVRVGDHVEVGQTIGIIEAMKIMNEIAADRAGLVLAVLVENGQAVEYGSPIAKIDPTRGGVISVVTSGS